MRVSTIESTGTALLAEAAEDALGEVDVVARRAARAVGALLRLDRDRERRAHRLAELAGDAALLAVRVAPQRVQAAEARALRRLLLGELHGDLAREQVPPGEHQALPRARAGARCRRSRGCAGSSSRPSVEEIRPARLHHRADEHDPDERDRNEHLPAEPHDLVVAVARKRRADPQEDEQHGTTS